MFCQHYPSFHNWRGESESEGESDDEWPFHHAVDNNSDYTSFHKWREENESESDVGEWPFQHTVDNNSDYTSFHKSREESESESDVGEWPCQHTVDSSSEEGKGPSDFESREENDDESNMDNSSRDLEDVTNNPSNILTTEDAYLKIFQKDHHPQNIAKDGNCLPSSIAFTVHNDYARHKDVRREVCNHMSQHESLYSEFVSCDNGSDYEQSFAGFLIEAKKQDTFLGQVFIKAAADYYGVDFVILDKSRNQSQLLKHSSCNRKKAKKNGCPHALQYENIHYEQLRTATVFHQV